MKIAFPLGRLILAGFLALLAGLISTAQAQTTYDWTGATNGNLSGTPTNYTPNGAPGSGDIIRWNAAGPYTTAPSANANMAVGELLFTANNTGAVTFGAGATTLTLNGVSGTGIQMDAGSGAVNTGGAKFALGAAQSWTNNSSNTLTIAGILGNGGFGLTVNGTGATTFTGAISGGGSLAISNGLVTLNGTNLFTGGTTLNSGTLMLGNNASLGGAASALTINGGTINVSSSRSTTNNNAQNWNGDFTFAGGNLWNTGTGAVTLGGNRQVTVSASTLTVGGAIGDTGAGRSLTKAGAGILALTGANTFSGGLTLSVGTLSLGNASALGATAGDFNITAGTTLDSSVSNLVLSTNNALKWNGSFTFTGTQSLDLGTGALTITGPLTVTSSTAANTLTAGGTISGGNGIFDITKAGAGGLTFSHDITLAAPGTITVSAGTETLNGVISGGNGVFDITKAGAGTLAFGHDITLTTNRTLAPGAGTLQFNGAISGTGFGLTANSANTVVLAGSNSYTGATTVSGGGTLKISGASGSVATAVSVSGASTLNFDSSTAGVTGTTRAPSVTLSNANLSVTGNATANSVDTITGALTLGGSSGLNIITLSGNAAKNAQLSVGSILRSNNMVTEIRGTSLGVSSIASATANQTNMSLAGSIPTQIGGGGALGTHTVSIIPWLIGSTSAAGGADTFVNYDATNGIHPLDVVNEYDASVPVGTNSTANVRITGANTTTISSNTTVNSLYLNGGNNLVTVNGSGTLTITSGALYLNTGTTGSATTTITANLDFGSAQGVIGYSSNGKTTTISGNIAGSNGLVVYGGGNNPLNVTGSANTYSGDTYIFASTSTYSVNTVLPFGTRTGDLYLFNQLEIAGSPTINGLNGNGTIVYKHGTANLTVGDNNASGSFSGGLMMSAASATGLTKIGTGTQILSGTSSNTTSATAVQNGILSVVTLNSVTGGTASSSLGAPVTVANGTIALGSVANTGNLTVVGTGETTDRVINLAGTTGGGTLDQSGTGLLKFTSAFTATGAGIKMLTLQGSTGGTGEVAGAIVNNSGTNKTSVTKAGTGTWTLSGINTYTGDTTITTGTLLVNTAVSGTDSGTGAGSIAVNGGTLGGTGQITPTGTNAISVANGAFIAPGASIGTLTVNLGSTSGTISLVSGAGFKFELGTANLSIGSIAALSSDLLVISGASANDVAFGGNAINFQGTATGQGFYKLFDTSFDSTTWTGLTLGGSTTGGTLITGGLTTTNFGGSYSGSLILGDGTSGTSLGDIYLNVVPEPSTWALLAFSLTAVVTLRRRRK